MNLCPELRRLSAEHARWLAEIERRAAEAGADRAARLLALWNAEIFPHCRAEEDVLLPELARGLSEADAAVVFTLGDHVVLRRLARELRAAEGAAKAAAVAELERKLAEHVRFEERTLFPALQETLGCSRLAGLARELDLTTREERHRPADIPPVAHEATKGRKGRKP
ncbi:MAG TPA: hemerythrin domain-containing protein [Anaeromyxobacteraceae bacterium]|nr:hemerythrin domain-containing protein [Anaeromyxobacteraceae bacterium]